jgi:quaternary ammonium compound-resistance protein SugE
MKTWLYIIAAVIMQTLWGIVLKFLDFGATWEMIKIGEILNHHFLLLLWPILAYIILGFLIAFALSKAYDAIAISIVYASWMGLTLVLQVLVDLIYFKIRMNPIQYVFILLVLIGIVGLKLSDNKSLKKNKQ